jgi:hypothetical protein
VTVCFVGHGIFYFSGCYCKKFCAYVLARTRCTLVTPTVYKTKRRAACDYAVIALFAVNDEVCMSVCVCVCVCVCGGKCRFKCVNVRKCGFLLMNLIPTPTRGRR